VDTGDILEVSGENELLIMKMGTKRIVKGKNNVNKKLNGSKSANFFFKPLKLS
jgi:hypothetical protein